MFVEAHSPRRKVTCYLSLRGIAMIAGCREAAWNALIMLSAAASLDVWIELTSQTSFTSRRKLNDTVRIMTLDMDGEPCMLEVHAGSRHVSVSPLR